MKKILLSDGTLIENCTDKTTANEIYVICENYEAAGAVRDLFTSENTNIIEVQDEDGTKIIKDINLVLIDETILNKEGDKVICLIKTRFKTQIELMQEEIAELQEVIIEG